MNEIEDFVLTKPVLIIAFVRTDTIKTIINTLRDVQAQQIYVCIDKGRNEHEINQNKIVAQLFNDIDWNCEIKIKQQERNYGCARAPKLAIDWFFENVEEGLIIEDDIIPSTDFYKFTSLMLEKYKNEKQVGCINGWSYFYNGYPEETFKDSYYFSLMQTSWGWATWKDAWNNMDLELKKTDFNVIESWLRHHNVSDRTISFYKRIFVLTQNNPLVFNTWDYQFLLSLFANHLYSVQPTHSLVRNVGNDAYATHTSGVSLHSIYKDDFFPLTEPESIQHNLQLDTIRIYNEHLMI